MKRLFLVVLLIPLSAFAQLTVSPSGGGGGGSGTVTSASVVTANGVSATVANPTTTPAFTFTLGAINPTTVDGLTITASTGTLSITNAKTVSFSNTLTFAGTDTSTLNIGAGGTLGSNAFTSTAYAPLASPAFTGNPTAPTQIQNNNSTNLSTTAYTDLAVANGIAGVNPAVAVQAATTSAGNTSGLTYNNGVSGIGATFTGTINTALVVDGFTFTSVGQRLLVKNDTQSPSGAFNGVYFVTQVQTVGLPPVLTRSLDYDSPSDMNNTGSIPVVNGTVNGSTSWLLTSSVATVGTSPLTYAQFSINPTNVALTNVGNTFTGASSITSWNDTTPVITGGLTASGSGSNDFSGSTGTFKTSTGAVNMGPGTITPTGHFNFTPVPTGGGVAPYISINIPADTGLTAGTEAVGLNVVNATRTWATTGTIALQREHNYAGPTYASASPSQTFTDVFNLYATPPIAGSNAIFTREHTLGIVDSTIASTSITGAFIVANALGTAGTSVGIGAGNVNAGGTVTGAIVSTANLAVSASAGGIGNPPIALSAGTNVSTPIAGNVEFDGVNYYATIDSSSKRGAIPVEQYFHLTSAGGAITTIANFFGATSNPTLVASGYYIIDFDMWFLSSSTGTVTWTLTNSAAPTSQNIIFDMSPVTGVVAPPGTATQLHGEIYNDATATKVLSATAALTGAANYHTHIQVQLQNGTGTSLKIQATVSTGNITPGINSYWRCRRMSPNNIGTFTN